MAKEIQNDEPQAIADTSASDKQKQIFDSALKKLMHLSWPAIISFINGLFGTDFPLDCEVRYPSTEQILVNLGKQFTDIIVCVVHNGEEYYLIIEAQIQNDGTMMTRVFSYAYQFALLHRTKTGNITKLKLVPATVIYFYPNSKTPESEIMRIENEKGETLDYTVNSLRLLDFTPEQLFERNLELLLPFMLLRLRAEITSAETSKQRKLLAKPLKELINELVSIAERSEAAGKLTGDDTAEIVGMIDSLDKYLYTKKYPILREVDEMLRNITYTIADRRIDEHIKIGETRGEAQKARQFALRLLRRGRDVDEIAEDTGLSVYEINELATQSSMQMA